jgi:hypothetical protein
MPNDVDFDFYVCKYIPPGFLFFLFLAQEAVSRSYEINIMDISNVSCNPRFGVASIRLCRLRNTWLTSSRLRGIRGIGSLTRYAETAIIVIRFLSVRYSYQPMFSESEAKEEGVL